jgi:hypothetical protein
MGRGIHRGPGRSDKREFQAGIGLRYKVAYTDGVRGFFNTADALLAKEDCAPPRLDTDNWANEREHDQFTLYNNPDKMGLTVVERRLSGSRAERKRQRWNMHDVGRVRGEISDALSELREEHGFRPMGSLAMRMTGVIPVGSPPGSGARRQERKFALVPAAEDKTARFLIDAHELVGDILGVEIEGAASMYEYTPKLTLGRIHNTVPVGQVAACGEALGLLAAKAPVTLSLTDQQIFDYHYQSHLV